MRATSTLEFISERNSRERPYEIYTGDSLHNKLACPSISERIKAKIRTELQMRQMVKRRRINSA